MFGQLWIDARTRLAALFARRRLYARADEELQFHLAMREQRLVESGVPAGEAHARALRELGNPTILAEQTLDSWRYSFVDTLIQDVQYGLRTMRRNPGFTLAAILSLSLGIGANTAVFSLMDTVMLRMLPVHNPERLVIFAHRGDGEASTGSNYPLYETLRKQSKSFLDVLAFWALPMKVRVGGETIPVDGQYVTPNYFSGLGARPILGRAFSEADAQDAVAVISYGLWKRSFAGSADVLGKTIKINGAPLTIIGVHPPEFFGVRPGSSVEVSVPIGLQQRISPEFGNRLVEREATWGLCIVGRLRDGVSLDTARAEAETLVRPWIQEVVRPALSGRRGIWERVELLPGGSGLDTLRRQFSKPLRILLGIVALVLLIACANITNLLLARSASRRRELALRASIGAGRFRLVRQLLTEAIVLAALGGAVGLVLAIWAARLLVTFLSSGGQAFVVNVNPDLRMLAFTLAISLLTAIIFGLVPALRVTSLDLSASLKEHSAGQAPALRGRTSRRMLVVGQVSLSLVLLIGASLFLRSLINIRGLDPGFNPERLLLVTFDPIGTGYRGERLSAFYRQVLERITTLPGVRSASLSSLGPLSGDDTTRFFNTSDYSPRSTDDQVVRVNSVSPLYFETMGIPVIEGRQFSSVDSSGSAKVAILNQAAARQYFGNRSAVGAIFRLGRNSLGLPIEVVGVVGDSKQKDLRDQPPRMVYFPLDQAPQSVVAEVRAAGDIAGVIAGLRQAIAAVNSEIPVNSIKTVREQVNAGLVQERLLATLSSLFGLLALLLASVGLYGVISYTVTMRTGEIGIRMALGAQRLSILWTVLSEAGLLVSAGVAVGVLSAIGVTRTFAKMLFGLTPTDPLAYLIASITLLVAATSAAFIPAYRASRIDPISALRQE
ncbi:MAG: ABC transporter permease [Bryobacterales bacterium]|nr:ABC transporter permease [Bryobacterales bacterium]